MEWILLSSVWPLIVEWPYPPDPEPWPGNEPTKTDLWLTMTTYEFVAARTLCDSCPAVLGRDLHVVISPDPFGTAWRIIVVTRCTGWRRHRHSAVVTEARGGLRFGPLESNPVAGRHRVPDAG